MGYFSEYTITLVSHKPIPTNRPEIYLCHTSIVFKAPRDNLLVKSNFSCKNS